MLSSLKLQPPPHCLPGPVSAVSLPPQLRRFAGTVSSHKPLTLSLNSNRRNFAASSPALEFLRQFSISAVFFFGLTLFSFSAASASTATAAPPIREEETQGFDGVIDEELVEAFEKWKSKSYALTVPIRVVTIRNSVPPVWFKHFLQSQGKRAKLKVDLRQSLQDIFHELSLPFARGAISPKSVAAADVVSLGDSWLNFAVSKELIEPMLDVEEEDWFRRLDEKMKVYLRRSSDGKLDPQGKIFAAPYRWGSMVIAYKKSAFEKRKLAPIEDWEDLWRPELAGKISMVDSTREVIGMVLKSMGASYNTENIDIQVSGGRDAVRQKLVQLVKQVRLFDSLHYLKSFSVGDTWVAVGWSADVIPAARRMSNVAVVVPKCGASLWADLWAVPAASKLVTDKIGGRTRSPSPLVYQWIEFCLQSNRGLHFRDEAIPGASPVSLPSPSQKTEKGKSSVGNLETNLVDSMPPADILQRCEFLEPLSDDVVSDYEWLVNCIQKKPRRSIIQQVRDHFISLVENFQQKDQVKNA